MAKKQSAKSEKGDIGHAAAMAAAMANLPAGANPIILGSRMRIWKQDPSVGQLGIRTTYVHGSTRAGPGDSQIEVEGLRPVAPDAAGDFLVDSSGAEAFDAVHTFAVVRQTLTMYQRLLKRKLPWVWNSGGGQAPIRVFPHAGEGANAYYSRNEQALRFFYFTPRGRPPGTPKIYTCRSFDIVTHEVGHAVLDVLKPKWIRSRGAQTGGLHEAFGDLTAVFMALSQLDLVEFIIAETKADLHQKTILSKLAEEFGEGLGRTSGLRNADNNLRLSEVSNEVHEISKVFTGGVYDVLADLFTARRHPRYRDDAAVLYEAGSYMAGLIVRAIVDSPDSAATYEDVVKNMMNLANADGHPDCAAFLEKHFVVREVLDAQRSFLADELPGNRCGCCGTMQHPENQPEDLIQAMATAESVVPV